MCHRSQPIAIAMVAAWIKMVDATVTTAVSNDDQLDELHKRCDKECESGGNVAGCCDSSGHGCEVEVVGLK